MPVYEKPNRGKNVWTIRVFIRGVPKSKLFRGKKAAALAEEAAFRLKKEKEYQDSGGELDRRGRRAALSFLEFCAENGPYHGYAQLHLKPRTWSNRQYQIVTMADEFGHLPLTEITNAVVIKYQRARRKRDKVSAPTVNDEVKVLKAILGAARELGFPAAKITVKPLKVRRRKVKTWWTRDQIVTLLEKIAELAPDIMGIVVCLANTGARRSEVINLKRSHVDLAQRLIYIEAHEHADAVPDDEPLDEEDDEEDEDKEYSPKTARPVPINDELLPWVTPKPGDPRSEYVFPCTRPQGHHEQERLAVADKWAYWPQKHFDRARKAAGLKGGPHMLRHSYASMFLRQRPNMFELARILGHSAQRTTELYSHMLPEHLAEARSAVSIPAPEGPAANAAKRAWRKTVSKTVSKGSGSTSGKGSK